MNRSISRLLLGSLLVSQACVAFCLAQSAVLIDRTNLRDMVRVTAGQETLRQPMGSAYGLDGMTIAWITGLGDNRSSIVLSRPDRPLIKHEVHGYALQPKVDLSPSLVVLDDRDEVYFGTYQESGYSLSRVNILTGKQVDIPLKPLGVGANLLRMPDGIGVYSQTVLRFFLYSLEDSSFRVVLGGPPKDAPGRSRQVRDFEFVPGAGLVTMANGRDSCFVRQETDESLEPLARNLGRQYTDGQAVCYRPIDYHGDPSLLIALGSRAERNAHKLVVSKIATRNKLWEMDIPFSTSGQFLTASDPPRAWLVNDDARTIVELDLENKSFRTVMELPPTVGKGATLLAFEE